MLWVIVTRRQIGGTTSPRPLSDHKSSDNQSSSSSSLLCEAEHKSQCEATPLTVDFSVSLPFAKAVKMSSWAFIDTRGDQQMARGMGYNRRRRRRRQQEEVLNYDQEWGLRKLTTRENESHVTEGPLFSKSAEKIQTPEETSLFLVDDHTICSNVPGFVWGDKTLRHKRRQISLCSIDAFFFSSTKTNI